jgi:glucokinase
VKNISGGQIQKSDPYPLTIGIDLGGTKVEIALVDGNSRITEENRYLSHAENGSEELITDLIRATESIQDKAGMRVSGIGIGVAGQVDSTGVVLSAPNLPFKGEPLQERLEKKLHVPVVVTNDVRAATYGEWRFGAGTGVDDLVVIFVGTGIGGGVVSGGRLLEGCGNTAGELGHLTLVANGRKCRCPNWGCIEAYAGGWAISERAQEAVLADPKEGMILTSLAGSVEDISAATVSKANKQSDLLAAKLVDETAQYLASGVVGIVNALNPCMLVLGGGVIEGLSDLIPIIDEVVNKRALKPNRKNLRIVKAGLGGKAGVIGAATLARSRIEERG